jgi:hypothetical protein
MVTSHASLVLTQPVLLLLHPVHYPQTPDGRPTGEAFVELKDEEAQREAMKRHKEVLGNRWVTVMDMAERSWHCASGLQQP